MDRAEHLIWCKKRALEYVDRGELANAVASMGSDLGNPVFLQLGLLYVMQRDSAGVRRWIEGFN
jgi:hypothetical protein